MAIQPQTTGVAHLALRVTDLGRSLDFYARVLGFPVAFEIEGLVGVMAGPTLLALRGPVEQTSPDDAFSPFRVGLDHVALGCDDPGELARVAQALSEAAVENTGVKHDALTGKDYVAFKDPDRISWELYLN